MMIGVLLAGAIGGCGREKSAPAPGSENGDRFEVHRTFGAGPVTFAVEVSGKTITTADAVACRMTLAVAEGYEAEFPDLAFPDDVPGTILTDYDERKETRDKLRLEVREYELQPEYEGKLRLPVMEVYYHKANEIREDVFETEPIEITETSSLISLALWK